MKGDQNSKSPGKVVRLEAPTKTPATERSPHSTLSGVADPELDRIANLLRFASSPPEIDRIDNDTLIALALNTEPSVDDEERRAAEELRRALERSDGTNDLVVLAMSLRAAQGDSAPLDDITNERMIRWAAKAEPRSRRRTWVAGAVAIAAGVALFIGSRTLLFDPTNLSASAHELVKKRSTQELFDPTEQFPVRGGESERADKIVRQRSADLRANQYARWGIR